MQEEEEMESHQSKSIVVQQRTVEPSKPLFFRSAPLVETKGLE
jgi:hypothetical protein